MRDYGRVRGRGVAVDAAFCEAIAFQFNVRTDSASRGESDSSCFIVAAADVATVVV